MLDKILITLGVDAKKGEAELKGFTGTIEKLRTNWLGLVAKISLISAPFLAVAASIKKTADAGEEMGKLSKIMGMTVENVSSLKYAAELSEASVGDLSTSMRYFNRALAGTNEEGDDTTQLLKALGITAKDPYEAMLQLADAFSEIDDVSAKVDIAMKLLGRSGTNLIPMFNEGAVGIRKMQEEAAKAGVVFDEKAAKAADEFNDNITRLKANLDGLTKSLGNSLIPVLNEMYEILTRTGRAGEDFKIGVLADNLKEVDDQIAFFEKRLAGRSILSTIFGDEEKIAELKARREQYQKELDAILGKYSQPAAPKGKREAPHIPDKSAVEANKQAQDELAKLTLSEEEQAARRHELRLKEGIDATTSKEILRIDLERIDQQYIIDRAKMMQEDAENWRDSMYQELHTSQEQKNELQKLDEEGWEARQQKMMEEHNSLEEFISMRVQLYQDSTEVIRRFGETESDYTSRVIEAKQDGLEMLERYKAVLESVGLTGGEAYRAIIAELEEYNNLLEYSKSITGDFTDGMAEGFRQVREEMRTGFEQGVDLAKGSMGSLQDTIEEITFDGLQGKLKSFADYANIVINELQRQFAKMVAQWVMGGPGGPSGGGGILGLISGMFSGGSGLDHSGLMGWDTSGFEWHKGGLIPRFHVGGLAADERLAINKVGERYITAEQNTWLTKLGNSMSSSDGGWKFIFNVDNKTGLPVKLSEGPMTMDLNLKQMQKSLLLELIRTDPEVKYAMGGG